MKVGVYPIDNGVRLPYYGTKEAACFDLFAYLNPYMEVEAYTNGNNLYSVRPCASSHTVKMMPGDRMKIPTGLHFDIPVGYSMRIHIRSGTALKFGIGLANAEGVIDSDYVDQLYITLINFSSLPFKIGNHERLCQGEIVKNEETQFDVLKNRPPKKGDRQGGFGSTGS